MDFARRHSDLIFFYKRLFEECDRRSELLRGVFIRCMRDSFCSSDGAAPFHNQSPWEEFELDNFVFKVGLWEDRSNQIYLFSDSNPNLSGFHAQEPGS